MGRLIKNVKIEGVFTEKEEPENGEEVLEDPTAVVREKCEELVRAAKAEAEKLLSEAKKEREKLLLEAVREAEEIKKNSYNEGLREGKETGLKMVREEMENLLEALTEELVKIKKWEEEYFKTLMNHVPKIISELAKKVVYANPPAVESAVKESLENLRGTSNFVLRVSAEDYAYVVEHIGDFKDLLPSDTNFSVESDPSLSKGDCLLESDLGFVDNRVEKKLAKALEFIEKKFSEK